MDPAPIANEGSVFVRIFNVLAAPGEVFQEIKERPVNHANWITPAVMWMVIGSIVVWLLYSMESFQYQIRKTQEKSMQDRVTKGKMTQAQVDQAMQMMNQPWVQTLTKVIMLVSVAVASFATAFFWGFIAWCIAVNIYKADIEYMKAVEAAGLASIIYLLATVISGLLSIAFGKLMFASPASFIHDFDMTNRNHLVIAALNPFYLWYISVLAVSISVLANVPVRKTLPWCLGIWILMRALFLSNQYTMAWVL